MKTIKYVDLQAQWLDQREKLLPILDDALGSGNYIGGRLVEEFEQSAEKYLGCRHVVSLNSGTDALIFALVAVGVKPGDEVITPPNSFIASTAAIEHLSARPVFVDVLPDQNISPKEIKKAITNKTKVIMPVHLTGRMADMRSISQLAQCHNIALIEDAAQAIGAKYDNKLSGTWGDIGCFSAHPLKNLNAAGDSGFLATNSEKYASEIRKLRNHGLVSRDHAESFGYVSRMDAIQASILKYRLTLLPTVIEKRRENAALYRSILDDTHVYQPPDTDGEFNTWHTFVIQVNRRDELKEYLISQAIETAIHYPVPIHLQPASRCYRYSIGDFPIAEKQAGTILSLPIHQYLNKEDIIRVADTINYFFKN